MKTLLIYMSALVVPLLCTFAGACCKKLIEARPFKISDWFLGLDLLLAAFTAGSVNTFDNIYRWIEGALADPSVLATTLVFTGCYTFGSVILLIFYMALHQSYVSKRSADLLSARICGFAGTIFGALIIYAFAVMKVRGWL